MDRRKTESFSDAGARIFSIRTLPGFPPADLFISSVAEAELRYGVARHPKGKRFATVVDEFLRTVTILPLRAYAWRTWT